MSNEINILMEMGFDKNRAETALQQTGNAGVEAAMEWLLQHPQVDITVKDNSKTEEIQMETEGITSEEKNDQKLAEEATLAKSLKCDDCGKLLRSTIEAEVHATKTGHSNFSESTEDIKPLTEEEKKIQLAKVQELLKQKRLEREEKEKREQLERERSRRTQGKEILINKQKLEEIEIKKLVDERKREKEDARLAKQRVREQIEVDKQNRNIKFGNNNQETSTVTTPVVVSPVKCEPASKQPPSAAPKEYMETKIQIRLLNGEKLTETFKITETLAAIRLFVQQNCNDLASIDFTFSLSYPRKDFTQADMSTPLNSLGLVPSAVLNVKKL